MGSVCALLLACGSHPLEAPHPQPQQGERGLYIQNPQLKLDIVFGIDNSSSMSEEQANLLANFQTFMMTLEAAVPAGTLDAHIAVVSSDLGVASFDVGHCNTSGGDNGVFQSQPRGACTSGPTGSYLVTSPAGTNFTGTIESAFSCIAALGAEGCGFEHQLASVRRALGADPAVAMPPENAGFLRSDARLGIIIISDEDDCSAPEGSDLFTPDTTVYGPLNSYRCNEYGHLCDGAPPPRAVVSGLTCTSNETDSTHLIKVGELVDSFRKLKSNPDLIRVAAIAGPSSPYATHVEPAHMNAIEPVPSCVGPGGNPAPAVRLRQFIEAFGNHGLFESICAADFGPAMKHIADELVKPVTPCVEKRLYDTDLGQAGIQPDCTVAESGFTDDGTPTDPVAVKSCAETGDAPPCWRLVPDALCTASPDGVKVSVDHGTGPAVPNINTDWSCRVCPDDADPACAR